MTIMKRLSMPALASALVLGAGISAAPQAAAAIGSITVLGQSQFRIFADDLSMGSDEFLQIIESAADNSYVVRVWDESLGNDGGLGRRLLTGVGNCLPAGVATAELQCTFTSPPGQVAVDFFGASGPTNVAVMDKASIALDFRGSAGSDYVQGGAGNDTLRGFGGDDFLYGGPGDDLLEGGPGDDYLEGEAGVDDMRGGSGRDTLEAADGVADVRVDCGGVPEDLSFDRGLDKPTNCGENPTPLPPAPIEPTDPPAPGEGEGTVDGSPTEVTIAPEGEDNKSVTISTGPANPLFQTNLWWFGTPTMPPAPTFPPLPVFTLNVLPLFPGSSIDVSLFLSSPIGPTQALIATADQRSGVLETVSLSVDSSGRAQGKIPIPGGLAPGNYTLQFNGVTAAGGQLTTNVGVRLDVATPAPEPQPEESITITSAKRGKGKKAAVITVRGRTVGLEGTTVTPRYRVKGAKKWTTAKPVRVRDSGAFRFKVKTRKKVSIVVRSGSVAADRVKVPAVRRR